MSLTREWVITRYDLFRANCDIVMDSIADRAAQADSGLQLSRPYRRGGVVLAVRDGERTVRSIANLTRADGEAFLALAPRVPVRTQVETFPLERANEALAKLRAGDVRGSLVIVP